MVDIVIVNWNSGHYLSTCIQSVLLHFNLEMIATIFIVDNNSSDQSIKSLPANNKIRIITNDSNLGFAKACNQGFKLCESQYILLLNPDTQLFETTLPDCISFMNAKNEVDILGCQLLLGNGEISKSCSRFPSPGGIFRDSTGLPKIAPTIFRPGIIMTEWDHRSSRYVDQVMGAFMFMRRSVFNKLGYFDEQFFVYYEEVDFSKRLALAGGKSFFNADIKAIHFGEGTTSAVKGFRLFLNLQSRLRYAKKHFSSVGYLCVWCCTYLLEPITRCLYLILSGKVTEMKDLLRGYKLLTGIS